MLGRWLHDPYGVDGAGEGLDLLPVETTFERLKLTRQGTYQFTSTLGSPWSALANMEVNGYEIRHGQTRPLGAANAALADGQGWVEGSVLGIAMHGLLESQPVLKSLFGRGGRYSLDSTLDRIADTVMANIDGGLIDGLVGLSNASTAQ